MVTLKRILIEMVVVVGAGGVIAETLYSDWWRSCCSALDQVTWVLFLPAFAFAIFGGGGVHGTSRGMVAFGIIIQLLLIWGAIRFFIGLRSRRLPPNPALNTDAERPQRAG
jgi:hypothetical protein